MTKPIPKLFFKIVFVVCSKLAEWARKKAGIEIDQHKEADQATKEIKDASDKVKEEPVDQAKRPPNDPFNNNDWNRVR